MLPVCWVRTRRRPASPVARGALLPPLVPVLADGEMPRELPWLEVLRGLVTDPWEPYDRLFCTSRAVRAMVQSVSGAWDCRDL